MVAPYHNLAEIAIGLMISAVGKRDDLPGDRGFKRQKSRPKEISLRRLSHRP
jgi:hypothetical protein